VARLKKRLRKLTAKQKRSVVKWALVLVFGGIFLTVGLCHVLGLAHYYGYIHDFHPYLEGMDPYLSYVQESQVVATIKVHAVCESWKGTLSANVPVDCDISLETVWYNLDYRVENISVGFLAFTGGQVYVASPEGIDGWTIPFKTSNGMFSNMSREVRLEFPRAGSYGARVRSDDDPRLFIDSLEADSDNAIVVADVEIGSQQVYSNIFFGFILVSIGVQIIVTPVATAFFRAGVKARRLPERRSLKEWRLRKRR